jgi:peptide chain release factor 1
MLDKLESIEKRYQELEQLLVQPDVATDPAQLQSLAQEQASLEDSLKIS